MLIAIAAAARVASGDCVDDCNADRRVTIDELIAGVRIALDEEPVATCPAADSNRDGHVAIAELVSAVGAALAGCPPTSPATASPTFTATPTQPTAASTPNRCGDGVLGAGETCETCAVDCQVLACVPAPPSQTFRVAFSVPGSVPVTRATVLVGYRSDRLSLPEDAASRVGDRQSGIAALVTDLDYGVRVILNTHPGTSVSSGQLFTIDFDSCQGAPPALPTDFGCQVESCDTLFEHIEGCECFVTAAAERSHLSRSLSYGDDAAGALE